MQATTSQTRHTTRTPEARLRCRVHQIARDLNLCEEARRNIGMAITGKRYAREMNLTELEVLVAWLERELNAKRRPPYTADELATIHGAQSVDELLGA